MGAKGKREVFMEETLKLVYQKGIKATTMRDIAKNANFEVANVYNYIDSKEAFLEGYLFKIIDEFTIYLDQIIDSTHCPKDKLKYVVSKHVQFTIKEPYQIALFVYDWRNLQEPRLSEFTQKRKDYLNKIGQIIEEGIKVKEFRNMNVEMATFLFFSSIRWLFNILMEEDKIYNAFELEKQLTDFILYGLGND